MPKSFFPILISLIGIVFFGYHQVHSQTNNSNNNTQQENASHYVIVPQPLKVALEPDRQDVESEKAYKARQEQREETNASRNLIGTALNSLLFILVLVQAFISHRQLNSMDASLTNTKAAFHLAERAYIGIKEIGFVGKPKSAGMFPPIQAEFINGGRTPAWNMRAFATPSVHPELPDPKSIVQESPTPKRGNFMPAGTIDRVTFDLSRSAVAGTDVNQVESGELRLVISMHVMYRDLMDEPQHLNEIYVYADGSFYELASYRSDQDI